MWSNIIYNADPNFISEFNLNTGVVLRQASTIYNPSVWHKVYVKNVGGYSRDYILGKLMNAVHPLDFTPVSFSKEKDYVSFLLKNCGAAINELCRLNLTIAHDESNMQTLPFKIAMFLKLAHAKDLKVDIQANITSVLRKRYHAATKTLNLEMFYKDPDLNEYCPLSQPKLMYFIMHISKEFEVEVLKLSNNGIRTLKPLEAYTFETNTKYSKILKVIDARKNNIDQVEELNVLKYFQLVSLDLDENPVCSKFTESEYIKHIRNLCPKITKLDGCKVTTPLGVLPLRRNYLCNLEAQGLVDQFLEHYFILYDTNRSVLEALYHKNAFFSLNCMYNTGHQSSALIARRFNEYKKMSRNVKLISDLSKSDELLFCGSNNIIRALSLLPPCKHDPYSFTVDMPYYTGDVLVISVSGVFKEPGQNLLDQEFLYGFTRTFVLKLYLNDEYNITNEMLQVSNASPTQQTRAFKIVKIAPLKSFIPIPNAKTIFEREEMLEAFVKLTELKQEWAKKCLIECSYDFKASLSLFTEFFKTEKFPADAFSFFVEKPKEIKAVSTAVKSYHDLNNIQPSYSQPYLSAPILQQNYGTPLPTPMPVQAPLPVQPPMPVPAPLPVLTPLPVPTPYKISHSIIHQPKPVPKPVEAPKPVPPPIIVQSNVAFQLPIATNLSERVKVVKNLITVTCSDMENKITADPKDAKSGVEEKCNAESNSNIKINLSSKNTCVTKESNNANSKTQGKTLVQVDVQEANQSVPKVKPVSTPGPAKMSPSVSDPTLRAAINLNPNSTQEEAKRILENALNLVLDKHCFAISYYRTIGKAFYRHNLLSEARNMLNVVMEKLKLNKVMGEEIYSTFTLFELQFGDLTIAEDMVIKTAMTFSPIKTVKLLGEHIAKINPDFSRKLFELLLDTDIDMEKKKMLLKSFKDFEIKHGTKETIEKVNKLTSLHVNPNKPALHIEDFQNDVAIVEIPQVADEIIDLDTLPDNDEIDKPISESIPHQDDKNVVAQETVLLKNEELSETDFSSCFHISATEAKELKEFRYELFQAAGLIKGEPKDPEVEELKKIIDSDEITKKSKEILTKRKYGLYYVKSICNILWKRKLFSMVREILVQSKNNIKNMHLRNLVIYYKIETSLNSKKVAQAIEKYQAHLKVSNNLEIFNFFEDLISWNEKFAEQVFNMSYAKISIKADKLMMISNLQKMFALDRNNYNLYSTAEKRILNSKTLIIDSFHPDDVLCDTNLSEFRTKYSSIPTTQFTEAEVLKFVYNCKRNTEAVIEGCRALFYHSKFAEARNLKEKLSRTWSKEDAKKHMIALIMFEAEFGNPQLGYDAYLTIQQPPINMTCAAICCLIKMKEIVTVEQKITGILKSLRTLLQVEAQHTILKYSKSWMKDYNFNCLTFLKKIKKPFIP